MSVSDIPVHKVRLIADAGNPMVEVHVIDGYFNRVAKGLRLIDKELAPGLYKVKFKMGSAIQEVFVDLKPERDEVRVKAPDLLFSTPVPLPKTKTTREYHREQVKQLSGQVHVSLGTGSQLFVFVRDLKQQQKNPATGVTLNDLSGKTLVNFAEQGKKEIDNLDQDPSVGCTVELNPGSYRLRVQFDSERAFEQIVVTSSGWQTQVFLLQQPYDYNPTIRHADLRSASISMTKIGTTFDPEKPVFRLAELARLGLANNRATLTNQDLQDVLREQYQNPMLGIYSAHLLLLSKQPDREQPDRELLRLVIQKLQQLIGNHPDVIALEVWLGEIHAGSPIYDLLRSAIRQLQQLLSNDQLRMLPATWFEKVFTNPFIFDSPPMLYSSWKILTEATINDPNIIPRDSLCVQVANHIRGNGLWFIYEKPFEVDQSERSKTIDFPNLNWVLERLVDAIATSEYDGDVAEIAEGRNLDCVEKDLLDCIVRAVRFKGLESSAPNEGQREQSYVDLISDKTLVKILCIPKAALSNAAAGLIKKLELISSIEETAIGHAVVAIFKERSQVDGVVRQLLDEGIPKENISRTDEFYIQKRGTRFSWKILWSLGALAGGFIGLMSASFFSSIVPGNPFLGMLLGIASLVTLGSILNAIISGLTSSISDEKAPEELILTGVKVSEEQANEYKNYVRSSGFLLVIKVHPHKSKDIKALLERADSEKTEIYDFLDVEMPVSQFALMK